MLLMKCSDWVDGEFMAINPTFYLVDRFSWFLSILQFYLFEGGCTGTFLIYRYAINVFSAGVY